MTTATTDRDSLIDEAADLLRGLSDEGLRLALCNLCDDVQRMLTDRLIAERIAARCEPNSAQAA